MWEEEGKLKSSSKNKNLQQGEIEHWVLKYGKTLMSS